MNHNFVAKVCAVALVCSLVAALPAQAQTKVKFALASTSVPGGTARIVKQLGLFAKYGLDAEVVPMDSGNVATAAVISGSAQFYTAAGTEAVVAQSRGQQIVAVTAAVKGIPAMIVLRKDVATKSGIPANGDATARVKALDGLIIAVPGLTGSYPAVVRSAARSAGANVKLVDLAQQAMPAALASSAIDGFISSSPFYGVSVLNGSGVIWLNTVTGDVPESSLPANSSVVFTMRSYAEQHPEVVKAVRDAYRDFAALAANDPEKIRQAVYALFPNADRANLDLSLSFEMRGFITEKLTPEAFAKEIAFVRSSTPNLPGLDTLDPAQLIAP